jgi:hypothetical protein
VLPPRCPALLLALAALAGACAPAQAPPFEIVVRVTSDKDKPVKGAIIAHDGKKVGMSGDDGAAQLRLRGEEGESFLFNVQCPAEFESPVKPIQIILRKVVDSSRRPEYEATCNPSTRNVVVAVRAENGAWMPVMYLGKEVARTDESGAAHVLLQLKPNEPFELQLNTSDKNFERLRPQNPVATFMVKHQDDLFSFDQKFSLEKKLFRYRGGPVGPTRLTN